MHTNDPEWQELARRLWIEQAKEQLSHLDTGPVFDTNAIEVRRQVEKNLANFATKQPPWFDLAEALWLELAEALWVEQAKEQLAELEDEMTIKADTQLLLTIRAFEQTLTRLPCPNSTGQDH